MSRGPVSPGESVAGDDAMTAMHAAGEMPDWLEEDLPPDPDGDELDWPGDAAEVAEQARAAQAEEDRIRARIVAGGIEHGYAHAPAAPPIPGVKAGPGGGFGQGEPLDRTVPGPVLSAHADYASGPGREFTDVSDDELFGLLGARRRLESRQAWERLMAVAELIRRRPAPGCELRGPARMPAVWAEGTAGELKIQLAISRRAADNLLSLAWDLRVKLPLTSVMLRDGVIDEDKAATIASYCSDLTPGQAHQAEQILFALDDVETMTWGMVRDRIARAVMEVNPDGARKRREAAANDRRIEVGPEESGNAMIAGRELPPVAVLALDQKLTARAKQLRALGVPGGMDELRVLAFLERWGEADPVGDVAQQSGHAGHAGNGGGIAAAMHLTAPAATMTQAAQRPGILRGTGPVDPDMVRDLADAAAGNPRTTFDFTLTDPDGRPVAHARGVPGPADLTRQRDKSSKPSKPGGPGGPRARPPTLTLIDRGPPGSHGTWRYTHHDREIIFGFVDLTGPCDHTYQAAGHDPGKLLRHLTGVLNQTCTNPACRRPQAQCDFEHSQPYDDGGITCLCSCGPVCRADHRDKQRAGWKLEGSGTPGWFRWITPSGRAYLSKPAIYPI